MLHDKYGPSDTEWCQQANGTIYFVQQRALKFTAAKPEAPDDTGRVFLAKGKSIGATCKVTAKVLEACKLTKASEVGPGDAIYVTTFLPEYYPLMMASAAIFTKVGGETCHAAIIARELNRPAISGVSQMTMDKIIKAGKVVIDGSSGKIYEALNEDEVVTESAKEAVVDDPLRTPDFALVKRGPYNVNRILYRFYKTLDNYHKGECTLERKNKVVNEIASVFCMYLYIATICETRWTRNNCKMSKARRNLLSVLTRCGVTVPPKGTSSDRTKFSTCIPQPTSLKMARLVNKWVTFGFNKCGWGGSYGGAKWAKISEVLGQYLNGQLSDTMFVDVVFNLRHNGNYCFDKFVWCVCDPSAISAQLNSKVKSINLLLEKTIEYLSIGTETLNDDVAKESILLGGQYTHFLTPKE